MRARLTGIVALALGALLIVAIVTYFALLETIFAPSGENRGWTS